MKSNLFIVGCVKGGTTWLFRELTKMSAFVGLECKEPHYFCGTPPSRLHYKVISDFNQYQRLVNDADKKRKKGSYIVDASATYLTAQKAPERIFNYNKEAKIIILLRNPIYRAFSQYLMDVREGVADSNKSFIDTYISDKTVHRRSIPFSRLYYELGLYSTGIMAYRNLFGSDVGVFAFSDLVTNPAGFINDVWEFLGVEGDLNEVNFKGENSFAVPRNKAVMRILGNDYIRKLSIYLAPMGVRRIVKERFLIKKDLEKPVLSEVDYDTVEKDYEEELDQLKSVLGISLYKKVMRKI
ncbi:sulfotransferase family protein [Candidatus Thiodiazotropha sp. CDECU1]|uniref:sulfotransferase family protein n=1 Tax=Candidatus Thiodiazotropha sp. CDECU1 TaxID=3065865 RepID=UPI00292E630E|nr:sulfotransferase [Candidatus Thiodiazotropha sp. CDECU1]